MTRIIESLGEVANAYDVLFCDLWGCLHDGIQAFPDAVAALRTFRNGGGVVVLLTNSPRPTPAVARQIERFGVPDDAWDDITTSGDAAQSALIAGAVGRRVHHMGPESHRTFFTEMADDIAAEAEQHAPIELVALDEAEGIVCTGPVNDLTDTPENYRAALLYAKARGLKLLCANPDVVVDYGERRLYCAGAIAGLYDEMGGESLYFGKPHPPIYDLARRRLIARDPARDDSPLLAVGDGVMTDIRGAAGEGIDALFVTGGLAARETGTERQPDPARLAAYLDGIGMDPALSIGFLR